MHALSGRGIAASRPGHHPGRRNALRCNAAVGGAQRASAPAPRPPADRGDRSHETDYVVIGSGIGGGYASKRVRSAVRSGSHWAGNMQPHTRGAATRSWACAVHSAHQRSTTVRMHAVRTHTHTHTHTSTSPWPGLCCAGLLARYGYRVTVVESHYLPGGAAHSFEVDGFKFGERRVHQEQAAATRRPAPGSLWPAALSAGGSCAEGLLLCFLVSSRTETQGRWEALYVMRQPFGAAALVNELCAWRQKEGRAGGPTISGLQRLAGASTCNGRPAPPSASPAGPSTPRCLPCLPASQTRARHSIWASRTSAAATR